MSSPLQGSAEGKPPFIEDRALSVQIALAGRG